MPRLPRSIRVGHMTFSIVFNREECDAMASDGHCAPGQRRIVIRPDLNPDREREVALHEVLHGVIEVANLKWDDDDGEERVVHAITGPLLSTLRTNKAFVNYLLNLE